MAIKRHRRQGVYMAMDVELEVWCVNNNETKQIDKLTPSSRLDYQLLRPDTDELIQVLQH